MKFTITVILALVSFNVLAKDAEKIRKPSNNGSSSCTVPTQENGELGMTERRATCMVKRIIEENSLASYLDALNILSKEGYTKPFGELKVIDLKSDTSGAKLLYSFLVVRTYSKEGAPTAFAVQNSILFYVDVNAPNNYTDSAQIEVRKIVANR